MQNLKKKTVSIVVSITMLVQLYKIKQIFKLLCKNDIYFFKIYFNYYMNPVFQSNQTLRIQNGLVLAKLNKIMLYIYYTFRNP